MKKLISFILTCYNEGDSIVEAYRRIDKLTKNLKKYDFEIIFVDNDSRDSSEISYAKLAHSDKRVRAILMSRNFGSPQPSFLAGLKNCKGDAAVLLHGDLQDPPELTTKFVENWEKGFEVVYGVRIKRRGYGAIMNFLYKSFYALLKKLAYIDIPLNAGEFSLIDRKAINELIKIEEFDYYLRCLRAFVGFRQKGVEYVRDARVRGSSTETIMSGFWWAKTIIINFSFKPLSMISQLAFLIVILSFFSILFFLVYYVYNPHSPRGIPTLFVLILFLGGVQLLSISVIAEYLSRIFLEVKKRPRYIIRKIIT